MIPTEGVQYIAIKNTGRLKAWDPVLNQNGKLHYCIDLNNKFIGIKKMSELTEEEYKVCVIRIQR